MPRIRSTVTLLLLTGCALYANAVLLQHAPPAHVTSALYQENNLLENVQLLLLMACLVTFAFHYFRSEQASARLIAQGAVLVAFTFLVRESDLRPLDVPAFITWFSDGPGRYVVLVPPWLALLWAARRHARSLQLHLRQLLRSSAGVTCAASALLLVSGVLFDKGVIRIAPSRYYEELCELNAYYFLLLTALGLAKPLRRSRSLVSNPL